ncbi:hypothetical protein Tco_0280777 [Tanacetum coccineum]
MLGKKRARKEQQQESSKKQRMEEDKESDEVSEDDEGKLMKHLVIKKDEDIAIDAIPLATKLPVIIDYKLHKEGVLVHYQLIRADGSSKRYSSMTRMLQGIDREDLEALWKIVKTKYSDIRPEDEFERVLWGDLKVMFEPDIRTDRSSKRYSSMIRMLQGIDKEDLEALWRIVKAKYGDTRPENKFERVLWGDLKVMFEPDKRSDVWRILQRYMVTIWKLIDSSRVYFVRRNLKIQKMNIKFRGGLLGLKRLYGFFEVTTAQIRFGINSEGSTIPPEPQPTPSTSQPNVLEPQTKSLQIETPPTVSHELQTEAHIRQILPSPFTYQRKQRKTQNLRRAKKVTELPQTSLPLDHGADEVVHKERVTMWKGLSLLMLA